jgi:hypothetical protein
MKVRTLFVAHAESPELLSHAKVRSTADPSSN